MLDGLTRRRPARVPTDEVVPARFFDDTHVVKGVVIRWMVRFDDVLDAEKLHQALVKLLSIGDWRRLGGRWRMNKQGKLEIHIPQAFDAARPAVRFFHESFDTDIGDHPLARRLPRATDKPSIQEGGDVFREFCPRPRSEIPQTLEDYLGGDVPSLVLQVITFHDATIVSLIFPHTLTDAVGLSAMITNWCRVLAGHEDEVQPLAVQGDPLERIEAGDATKEQDEEEYILSAQRLAGFRFVMFVLHFIYELVFGPKMETRMLFLPHKAFETLKQRTQDEFQAACHDASDHPSYISEGDILTAWGTKMVALGRGPSDSRHLALVNVFELRNRAAAAFEPSLAYVQNAFFTLNHSFAIQEARASTVGQLALRLRAGLLAQTTEAQVRALVREQRASLRTGGQLAVYAESNSILLPFSNWCKARFFEVVDFSPAVLCAVERPTRASAVGKPVFFLSFDSSPKANPTFRNVINILGKDAAGNYWITGMLSAATWAQVAEALKTLE